MKTDLNIRPMTPQEKIYAELQSSQISQQTGFIGVLVGNFNQQDKNQPMKWNILREPPIREAFWSEAQSVLKELRNTIFKDRNTMQEYCASHTSFFKSQSADAYGLRVDSARYSYLILCSPQSKDHCLYLYAYSTEALEHHMKKLRGASALLLLITKRSSALPMEKRYGLLEPMGISVTGSAGILTTITSKQRGDLAEPYTTFVNLPNFANKQEAG